MELQSICPKCNVMLVLREREGTEKILSVCPNCGYERELQSVTEHTCEACGCGKAIITFYGVIYGDEQPLTMYKCIRCGKVDREGIS